MREWVQGRADRRAAAPAAFFLLRALSGLLTKRSSFKANPALCQRLEPSSKPSDLVARAISPPPSCQPWRPTAATTRTPLRAAASCPAEG